MKYLRLIFFAFVVFCIVYAVRGESVSGAGGNLTVVRDGLNFTYNWNRTPLSGTTQGVVRLRVVAASGATTGTSIVSAASGSPTSGSGAGSGADGEWLWLNVDYVDDSTILDRAQTWVQLGLTEIKYRVAGTNGTASVMRKYLVSGGTEVIGYVEALPGANYDHTFTVTSAQDAAGLSVVTYLQDEFKDGVWVQNNTFNTSTATLLKSEPVSGVTVPAGGIPDAPPSAYSPPGPTSAAPTAQTSISGIWSSGNYGKETTDSDRLDKSTYREGVDKLETELKGKASDVPDAPTTEGTPVFTAPENPNRLASKLPSAPTVTAPTPVTAVTVALEIPGINVAPVTIDFDRPGFSGPVSIFRAIMLGVMTLIYLILSIRTVRGAFAGK